MRHDAFGDRMKKYEYTTRNYLLARTPIIIRLDGTHFHTFAKNLDKPFDKVMVKAMQETMLFLCKKIPGVMLGYTQSDEISLFIQNYENLETNTWFDGNIQKIVSVSASMASAQFAKEFMWYADEYCDWLGDTDYEKIKKYHEAMNKGAYFDARVFNIPKEEVTNYFLWREMDAMRNSINMVGFAKFSPKLLFGKTTKEITEILAENGVNYDTYPTYLKRGSCCRKISTEGEIRPKWVVDLDIPVFKNEGRKYIDDLVYFQETEKI